MILQKIVLLIGAVIIAFMLFNIPMKEERAYTKDTYHIIRSPDYLKTTIQVFAISLVTAAAFYASGSQRRRFTASEREGIIE